MPPLRMSPGTLLGGRYRLDDLLADHDGARFWRATDTVLARSVAVHVVASDDARAACVLDAARRAAGLVEPHFLQVLDCDDVDGLTWVVNEWGDGASLDIMLEQGPLPAVRAAWLTREVAEAITAAHALGLVHGRLTPESVMVSQAGAVRVVGFQVSAALSPPRRQLGEDEQAADVLDLAGILYAALTGRWAGVSPSRVPAAPTTYARGPLRPRQVRAGVPRALDAICDRVLHRDPGGHLPPIRTALEIGAALSDFVGDPAAVAPVDLPSMHDEPEPPAPVVDPPLDLALDGDARASDPPADSPPLDATMAAPIVFDDALDVPPVAAPTVEPALELADERSLPAAWEPEPWNPAPPGPFEQPADRPLFADHDRRVPEAPGGGPAHWPFETAPAGEAAGDRRTGRTGRAWLRVTAVVVLVIALLAAMVVAFNLGHRDEPEPVATAPDPTTAPASPSPTPYHVVGVTDFDPQGKPPRENPAQAKLAIDSDATTGWSTQVYRSAALGGLKSGVGLLLDLGTEQQVGTVDVRTAPTSAPTQIQLRATPPGVNDGPTRLADTRKVSALATQAGTALFTLDPVVRTRYLLLWLTRLPGSGTDYRGTVLEVSVTS